MKNPVQPKARPSKKCNHAKRFFTIPLAIGLMVIMFQCEKEPQVIDLPDFLPEAKAEYDTSYTIAIDTVKLKAIDKETAVEKDQSYLCRTSRHSVSENPAEFANSDPLVEVLWPGLIIKGSSAYRGIPVVIPCEDHRKNITVSLSVVSGGSGTYNREIKPVMSQINQAMNSILSGYNGGAPARYSYSMELITSQQHLEAALRAGWSSPVHNLTTAAGFNFNEYKSTLLVTLTQSFFTFSIDALSEATAFTEGKTPAELESYIKPEADGTPNPLAYISSVTYGRVYKLLYTTTDKSFDLAAAVNYAYNGAINDVNVGVSAAYQQRLSSLNVQVWQVGGDASSGLETAFINNPTDISSVKNFIVEGARFSKDNVGAPISYTIRSLKENYLLSINNTLEYDSREYIAIADPTDENTVTDIDGNVYYTVTLGTQTWMAENLKTTRYNDGEGIPLVTDAQAWGLLTTPGFCWYDNKPSEYKTPYGALYNFFTVKTGKLCPAGWHVPDISEWRILAIGLAGEEYAGGHLKEAGTAHWQAPNTGATNSSGFTALPGGGRGWNSAQGKWIFSEMGTVCYFYSSTPRNAGANFVGLSYSDAKAFMSGGNGTGSESGLSVRCVKDY